MVWTILAIILVIWLVGLVLDVAGSLIHLLLAVAALVIMWKLITGRRAAP